MARGVRDIADEIAKKANIVKERALWDEGGAGRAAIHAIAGSLLGGVNGVDNAIKAAIGAGVSTAIAPYINDIVKDDSSILKKSKRLLKVALSTVALALLLHLSVKMIMATITPFSLVQRV
ncbi:hypothetical protein [uncultured Bartonella sp.]|uniref:hypothetical protein n=1 Tax=uncultured Bartonella sp. TaxID=104108 RepID=UPI0025F59F9A|nr:hypothetical protein [uncultured Bartonella sp.]